MNDSQWFAVSHRLCSLTGLQHQGYNVVEIERRGPVWVERGKHIGDVYEIRFVCVVNGEREFLVRRMLACSVEDAIARLNTMFDGVETVGADVVVVGVI